MIIDYHCPTCNEHELSCEIVPFKKCPKCKQLMNAEEVD